MRSRAALAAGSALLASVLLLGGAPLAAAGAGPAGPYRVQALRVVSGPSPLPAGCPGARFDDKTITGHELEPMIAVNPANPRNIVAAWKQDVGSANQTRSDLVASSLDGGKTWTRSTIPGLSACTGGTADSPPTRGWRPAATALSTSAGLPPRCRPIRPRPRSWRAAPATAGAAGRCRRQWQRRWRAMRPMRSPPVPGWPGMPTWPGPTSSSSSSPGPIPWSSRARPTAGARGRLRPGRPAGPARHRPGPQSPRAAGRDAAGRVPARRLRARARPALRRALARRGADVAAAGAGRLQPDPVGRPCRSRHGPPAAGAGVPQRGGRPGRHRLRRLRKQHLGELGGDRRGEVAGRRPHLDQRPAARHHRVRVRARDRRRCTRHGRRDLVRPAQRPAGR